jgi:hypothetical protein
LVPPLRFSGVQKYRIQNAKKPASQAAALPPEMTLSQGALKTILDEIIRGMGIAQERQRITA